LPVGHKQQQYKNRYAVFYRLPPNKSLCVKLSGPGWPGFAIQTSETRRGRVSTVVTDEDFYRALGAVLLVLQDSRFKKTCHGAISLGYW